MFQTGSAENIVPEATHFRVAFKVGERLSTTNQKELMLFMMANGVSDIQLSRRGLSGTCTTAIFQNSMKTLISCSTLSDDLKAKIESVYIPSAQPFNG
jgi:hypothetical protein